MDLNKLKLILTYLTFLAITVHFRSLSLSQFESYNFFTQFPSTMSVHSGAPSTNSKTNSMPSDHIVCRACQKTCGTILTNDLGKDGIIRTCPLTKNWVFVSIIVIIIIIIIIVIPEYNVSNYFL